MWKLLGFLHNSIEERTRLAGKYFSEGVLQRYRNGPFTISLIFDVMNNVSVSLKRVNIPLFINISTESA